MAFAADMHVFPGGRVDPADSDPRLAERSVLSPEAAAQALGDNLPPGVALATHVAAIRELFEEAGVLLADGSGPAPDQAPDEALDVGTARSRLLSGATGIADVVTALDLRLRTDLLVPIAHWSTPPFMDRRFSTWFFAADLPPGAEVSFEGDEVIAHRWLTPAAALDQLAEREIAMWVPTSSVLQGLAAYGARSAPELRDLVRIGRMEPPQIVEEHPDRVTIAVSGSGGVPGRAGTIRLIGRREIVVVDPSDPSDEAIEAIGAAVARRDGTVRAIVLTSPEPGRAAGAESLRIPLAVPILVAPGAGRHLPYATRELADGEALPADVAVSVRLGPAGSGRLEVVATSARE